MFKQVIDIFELLDRPDANAGLVKDYLLDTGTCEVATERVEKEKGATEFIRVTVPGTAGRISGGDQPTLGIIGRLGGLGARPEITGFVSDGDGALTALSAAAKLSRMHALGDHLAGDVVISTHICPDAPTRPHKPVAFMDSPMSTTDVNSRDVRPEMQAILSIDTTKGNRVINQRGFAISPTVKEGYILKVSEDLLDLMTQVTGMSPRVFALTQQDITPYGNGVDHINSILQPATVTSAPVVGVALVTDAAVAGCASGATHLVDVESAARYVIEVAKSYTSGACAFYNSAEYDRLLDLYGDMTRFQTGGAA